MTATLDAAPRATVFPPRAAARIDPPEQHSAPSRMWRSKEITRAASLAGEPTLPPVRVYERPTTSYASRWPQATTYYTRGPKDSRRVEGRLPEEHADYAHAYVETAGEHRETFDNDSRVMTTPCLLRKRPYGTHRGEPEGHCPHPQHLVENGLHERIDEVLLDHEVVISSNAISRRVALLEAADRLRQRSADRLTADEQRFRAELDACRSRRDECETSETSEAEALRYWTGPTAGGMPVLGNPASPASPVEGDIVERIDEVLANHDASLITATNSTRFMVTPLGEVVDLYALADEHNRVVLARLAEAEPAPAEPLLRRACSRVRRSLTPLFFNGLAI